MNLGENVNLAKYNMTFYVGFVQKQIEYHTIVYIEMLNIHVPIYYRAKLVICNIIEYSKK